jgi:hypothetical protein
MIYGHESADAAPLADLPEENPDTDSTPAEKPAETPPAEPKKEEPPKGTEDDAVKKQAAEQRKANQRLGREVKDLKAKMDELIAENQRLRGETPPEPPKPTAEQVAQQAEWKGREQASRARANELFGEAEVTQQIYGEPDDETGETPQTPYTELIQVKPWIHVEVMKHPQPAVRAMQLLQREDFYKKYGDDSTQWVAKIEAELKPKVVEELKKQIATPPTGKQPPTVSEGRGAGAPPGKRTLATMLYGETK